jgi:hypothetical protein
MIAVCFLPSIADRGRILMNLSVYRHSRSGRAK